MAYALLFLDSEDGAVSMLRIHRSTRDGTVRVTLSGRIDAEHLPELQRSIDGDPARGLVLNLEEVKLVDQDAVRFLARCEASGATLEGCPQYVREWIASETTVQKRPRRQRNSNRPTTRKRGERP